MNVKPLLIIVILIACVYYIVEVQHFNPFSDKVSVNVPVTSFNGEQKTLKDYEGKNGILLIRMSTWCSYCPGEIKELTPHTPNLQSLKIGLVFAMSAMNNNVNEANHNEIYEWMTKYNVPWDWPKIYWQDNLYDDLKIKKAAVPYFVLIDRNYKIFFPGSGGVENLMNHVFAMLDSYKEFKGSSKK